MVWDGLCRGQEREALTAAEALEAECTGELMVALAALGYPGAGRSPQALGTALRSLRGKIDPAADGGQRGRLTCRRRKGGTHWRVEWERGAKGWPGVPEDVRMVLAEAGGDGARQAQATRLEAIAVSLMESAPSTGPLAALAASDAAALRAGARALRCEGSEGSAPSAGPLWRYLDRRGGVGAGPTAALPADDGAAVETQALGCPPPHEGQ